MQGGLFPWVTGGTASNQMWLTRTFPFASSNLQWSGQPKAIYIFYLEPVLVSWDCCGHHKFDGLKQQKFIFLRSWSPKSKIKVSAGPCSPLKALPPWVAPDFLGLWKGYSSLCFQSHCLLFPLKTNKITSKLVYKVTEPSQTTVTVTLGVFLQILF